MKPIPPPWDALGLTETEIAAALKTPRRTCYSWIHGQRKPGAAARELIARLFRAHNALDPYRDPGADWWLTMRHHTLGTWQEKFNGSMRAAKLRLTAKQKGAGPNWYATLCDTEGRPYATRSPGGKWINETED